MLCCVVLCRAVAFEYTTRASLTTEAVYPFRGDGAWGACRGALPRAARGSQLLRLPRGADGAGYATVAPNSASAMRAAVAAQPVVVYLRVGRDLGPGGSYWQHYSGGVYAGGACGARYNHAVLLVGYNATASPPYWIAKNSWGEDWGTQGGYILLAMEGDGPGLVRRRRRRLCAAPRCAALLTWASGAVQAAGRSQPGPTASEPV